MQRIHSEYRDIIANIFAGTPFDPLLIEAMIIAESSGVASEFKPELGYLRKKSDDELIGLYGTAVRDRLEKSYGLMQVMLPTAYDCGFSGAPELLFVPQENIGIGKVYLEFCYHWARDQGFPPEEIIITAVMKYNAGMKRIEFPNSTIEYAAKIFRIYEKLIEMEKKNGQERRAESGT